MNHYIELKVLPDPEFPATVLLNAVYAKLHRVLMCVAEGRLGVSFPNCGKTLGDVLRVHGSKSDLLALAEKDWLKGMRDYTNVSDIAEVPSGCQHRTVSRKQSRTPHNKRARAVNKGWLSEEEALDKFPDEAIEKLNLPYAQFKSLSKSTVMRVWVELGSLVNEPVDGKFSSYGLSKTATVPWF